MDKMAKTVENQTLNQLAAPIEKNRATLATINTLDNGTPYTVALTEDLTGMTETVRYNANFADRVIGQVNIRVSKLFT